MKIFYVSLLLLACGDTPYATVKAIDGAGQRQVWFKSADELENELVAWRIPLRDAEKSLYISTLGALYGGTDIERMETLLAGPSSSYVLALDIVSNWLSKKLLNKQLLANSKYLFDGSAAPPDNDNCFGSDAPWCDFDDELTLGAYTRLQPPSSVAERKKVMHNIQDIGDFLGITIDNLLLLNKTKLPYQHVPHYIMEEIFIPHLDAKNAVPASDYRAWQKVVHVLLMSGQFFMKLNIERN